MRRSTMTTLLLLMAREILQGPSDAGRASYQVAVALCDSCGQGFQHAAGELVQVEPAITEMARCDARDLPVLDGSHVGDRGRASQDVAPALRRQVMRRDHGRCAVPGCRHGTFVDLHHLLPRSEGGEHCADNLIVLCPAHHRAEHRGQLVIEGTPSTGLVFKHADGSSYGGVPCARTGDLVEKAFLALRGLGFRENSARSALNRVTNQSAHLASIQELLKAALAELTPT